VGLFGLVTLIRTCSPTWRPRTFAAARKKLDLTIGMFKFIGLSAVALFLLVSVLMWLGIVD